MSPQSLTRQLKGEPAQTGARSQATVIESSRALAEVQAMVVVAQRFPRSHSKALSQVVETCQQKEVAEEAFFKFPRAGKSVTGETIHLARELARCWGNIDYGIKELNRDDERGISEMIAIAWDLETNARNYTAFIVPHVRDTTGGHKALTDVRDIYENNANMGARRLREMILATLPRWLVEAAKRECYKTLSDGGAEPMPVRIAKMVKTFEDIGISKARIKSKTGLEIDALTEIDIANLGVSFRSIKRGEITAEEEFPAVAAATLTEALGSQETSTKAEGETQGADALAGGQQGLALEMSAADAYQLGEADAKAKHEPRPAHHKIPESGPLFDAYFEGYQSGVPSPAGNRKR